MEGQEGSAGTSYAFMSFTDAGMLALWNPRRFADIVDYESWERQLYDNDDILRHVRDGHLVPVNIGGDGAFDFTVRTATDGDATPTEREARHLWRSSAPYLLISEGEVCLSGLEHIGADLEYEAVKRIPLRAGRYKVVIHIFDDEAEAAALDDSADPTPNVLSGFLVLIGPKKTPAPTYRVRLKTFDRRGPDAE
jgi:hypothetical protein